MKLFVPLHLLLWSGLITAQETSPDNANISSKAEDKHTNLRYKVSDERYDCDADGQDECGIKFIHSPPSERGCKDYQRCMFQYQPNNAYMKKNCVCRRCFDKSNTAAEHVPYDFEDIYRSRFRSWHRTDWTCASWVFPKNDQEILDILAYARENGYTVRPSGSSHTTGGLVSGADDSSYNTIALSLGQYVAPSKWQYVLKERTIGDATVVVNAGWSQLELYGRIRPKDYMLPAATSGPLFQLAGLVANTCHGGWYGKGFIHQYVVKMRVVTHDGTFKVITDPEELRYWRSSFGLLGIITSMEFKLDYNPRFQEEFIKKSFPWSKENFWSFVKQDASADLPDSIGGRGPRKATSGQFFLDPYAAAGGEAVMSAVVFKKNENAEDDYEKPLFIEQNYQTAYDAPVFDEDRSFEAWDGQEPVHRYMKYGDLIKIAGGPDVLPWDDISSVNNALARDHRFMTQTGLSGPGLLLPGNARKMNDGFFATKVPQVMYSAYLLPASNAFEALDDLVKIINRVEKEDAPFKWNGPPELRFIQVEDDAVLNQVPAGLYTVIEPIAFPFPEFGPAEWDNFYSLFKEVEDLFMDKYGAKPHIGKIFGVSKGSDGIHRPYQVEESCKIYTDAQKADFLEYKQRVDPNGLFEGGDGMKLLSPCPTSLEHDEIVADTV